MGWRKIDQPCDMLSEIVIDFFCLFLKTETTQLWVVGVILFIDLNAIP